MWNEMDRELEARYLRGFPGAFPELHREDDEVEDCREENSLR